MPFFSFNKVFSRARVADAKPTSVFNSCLLGGEMTTPAHLVSLSQASDTKNVKIRTNNIVNITGTGPLEMVADVGLWEALSLEESSSHRHLRPSALQGDRILWQQRSVSGSSAATAVSVGSCDSGDTLIDEISTSSGEVPPSKVKTMDDSLADIDQDALFDELEALCNPKEQVPVSQSALFAELELLCAEPLPAPVPAAVRSTTAKSARRQARVEGVMF